MSEPWVRLKEQTVYEGYRKIARRNYRLPDGAAADFEILLEPQVVSILAVTPQRKVILARQYRPGPERFLLELPGGAVEAGETTEQAACRELMEETGCEGEIHFVGESMRGAYTTMIIKNYVALDCRRLAEPVPDAHEFIDVVELPLNDFRALLRSGQLTDVACGYLGLDFLGWL